MRKRRSRLRADAEHTDLAGIYILETGQIGDGGFDVFHALGGVFEVSWFTLGLTLICGVVGEADEAGLGEHAGVIGWGLLFDGGPGMAYDNGGAGAAKGIRCWVIEVGCEFEIAGEKGNVLG